MIVSGHPSNFSCHLGNLDVPSATKNEETLWLSSIKCILYVKVWLYSFWFNDDVLRECNRVPPDQYDMIIALFFVLDS